MPLIQSKKAALAPNPLSIRLPLHLSLRAETPQHAIRRVVSPPEPTPVEFIEDEEAKRMGRFQPFIRVATIAVTQPEPRGPSPDHYGLRQHLEGQRHPRVQEPPRSDA